MTSSDDRMVAEAMAVSAIAKYLPSPVTGLTPLAGSISNQDFMVHTTTAGGFVLKIGDRRELSAEAWACTRVRTVGVAGPEIIAFEPSPASLPRPFLLMRRLPGAGLDSTPHHAFVEAGRQLRLVHSIQAEGYGFLADTDPVDGARSGPHATWAAFTDEAPNCLGELVDRHVISVDLAGRIRTTVFAEHETFAGLIDWGDVAVGDPRYDLARFSINAPGALAPLLDGYDLGLNAELRLALAVYRVIRMTTTLLYELRLGRGLVRQLPHDHRDRSRASQEAVKAWPAGANQRYGRGSPGRSRSTRRQSIPSSADRLEISAGRMRKTCASSGQSSRIQRFTSAATIRGRSVC
jgi:Phosphotransferase enzyme family.